MGVIVRSTWNTSMAGVVNKCKEVLEVTGWGTGHGNWSSWLVQGRPQSKWQIVNSNVWEMQAASIVILLIHCYKLFIWLVV